MPEEHHSRQGRNIRICSIPVRYVVSGTSRRTATSPSCASKREVLYWPTVIYHASLSAGEPRHAAFEYVAPSQRMQVGRIQHADPWRVMQEFLNDPYAGFGSLDHWFGDFRAVAFPASYRCDR